jgi:hypothetical protein
MAKEMPKKRDATFMVEIKIITTDQIPPRKNFAEILLQMEIAFNEKHPESRIHVGSFRRKEP